MENNTPVSFKKTRGTDTVSSHGKTVESTRVTGCKASNMVREFTETQREKRREAFGTMVSALAGLTSLTTTLTLTTMPTEQSEPQVKKLPVSFIRILMSCCVYWLHEHV